MLGAFSASEHPQQGLVFQKAEGEHERIWQR